VGSRAPPLCGTRNQAGSYSQHKMTLFCFQVPLSFFCKARIIMLSTTASLTPGQLRTILGKCTRYFSFLNVQTDIAYYVKYPSSLSVLMRFGYFPTDFLEIVKCYGNPSSGSRVVSFGRTDRHRQDEPNSRYLDFANSPKTPSACQEE